VQPKEQRHIGSRYNVVESTMLHVGAYTIVVKRVAILLLKICQGHRREIANDRHNNALGRQRLTHGLGGYSLAQQFDQ
jgi:hypothetical protein